MRCAISKMRIRYCNIICNLGQYADNILQTSCPERDVKISTIFAVAAALLMSALFIMGLVLDRLGPKICSILSASIAFAGALLFAFSDSTSRP